MEVKLKEVTIDNIEEVADLELDGHQKYYVADKVSNFAMSHLAVFQHACVGKQ